MYEIELLRVVGDLYLDTFEKSLKIGLIASAAYRIGLQWPALLSLQHVNLLKDVQCR